MNHFNMIDTNRLHLTNSVFKETEYQKVSVDERVGIVDAFILNMGKQDQQIYNTRFSKLTCNQPTLTENSLECDDANDKDSVSNFETSTTITMSQLSQDLGNHDIHNLQSTISVKKTHKSSIILFRAKYTD